MHAISDLKDRLRKVESEILLECPRRKVTQSADCVYERSWLKNKWSLRAWKSGYGDVTRCFPGGSREPMWPALRNRSEMPRRSGHQGHQRRGKGRLLQELTLSTLRSWGFCSFSVSFRSPQSGSSLSFFHLAYFFFFNMARKSIPLASVEEGNGYLKWEDISTKVSLSQRSLKLVSLSQRCFFFFFLMKLLIRCTCFLLVYATRG